MIRGRRESTAGNRESPRTAWATLRESWAAEQATLSPSAKRDVGRTMDVGAKWNREAKGKAQGDSQPEDGGFKDRLSWESRVAELDRWREDEHGRDARPDPHTTLTWECGTVQVAGKSAHLSQSGTVRSKLRLTRGRSRAGMRTRED